MLSVILELSNLIKFSNVYSLKILSEGELDDVIRNMLSSNEYKIY